MAAYDVLAAGTDTGGSIREPASMCGVVGVAPSAGSVPVEGTVDFAPTLDRVGPLAATVRDAALLHEVMAGTHGLVRAAEVGARERLVGHSVGVIEPMCGERNAPEVLERFLVVLERLRAPGTSVVPITVPRFGDLLDVYVTISSVEALPMLEEHAARSRRPALPVRGGDRWRAVRPMRAVRPIRTGAVRTFVQSRSTQLCRVARRYDNAARQGRRAHGHAVQEYLHDTGT